MKLENFSNPANMGDKYYDDNKKGENGEIPFAEEHLEDDFEELSGVENEYTRDLKEKINNSKRTKGRGLLLSFFEFN